MRTLWLFVGLMLFSLSANGEVDPGCPFKNIRPTRVQLKTILANHQKWVDKNKEKIKDKKLTQEDDKDPLRANLCMADLTGAYLQGYLTEDYLQGANLSGANLYRANFTGTKLVDANLAGADLRYTKLTGTYSLGANLSGATLEGANLTNANFGNANLSGADLYEANLTGAKLDKANLTGADLRSTNLTDTVFSIKSGSLPIIELLVDNPTLDKLDFTSKTVLVELRKKFYDSGYTNEGKKISKVLNHRDNEKRLHARTNYHGVYLPDIFTRFDGMFRLVFFEWPTDWGVEPGRALKILVFGIVVFMFFYMVALQAPEQPAGVWKIRAKERLLDKDLEDEELIRPTGFWQALSTAFYFSLLSAFHFGWRDLNVGSWIMRLQRKEHTYRATGWVRTVAGVQSLMSVYLVAMWALTYFGHPFD